MKIAYLFTTFPVTTETFLQREIRIMLQTPVDVTLYSIWGGEHSWEGHTVERFPRKHLWKLLIHLPYWALKKPRVLKECLERLFSHDIPSRLNLGENLFGLAFAIIYARHFLKEKPDLIHGVWATMPTTAGWLLKKLTDIPFSMGAHAYDVFQHGGDWILKAKLRQAILIHTTTQATRHRLIHLGAHPSKIALVRRGLDRPLPDSPIRQNPSCLHILSIGRLVHKKGYPQQLAIYSALKKAGIPFKARIIGRGPLAKKIQALRDSLGLTQEVELIGKLEFSEIPQHYQWADVFFFTGTVAPDGDRDGLPNVIPEAMSAGVPVVTSPVAGTTEAIAHRQTGLVYQLDDHAGWIEGTRLILERPEYIQTLCENAQKWVNTHFMAQTNARLLADKIQETLSQLPTTEKPTLVQTPSLESPQLTAH